jgi:hypothetical protein
LKHKVLMSVIMLFCLLQAGNLIMSLINSGKDITEVLIENEETEKTGKEKQAPNEWYALFSQNMPEFDFFYTNYTLNILEIVPCKSFLAQPETPPPNPA